MSVCKLVLCHCSNPNLRNEYFFSSNSNRIIYFQKKNQSQKNNHSQNKNLFETDYSIRQIELRRVYFLTIFGILTKIKLETYGCSPDM